MRGMRLVGTLFESALTDGGRRMEEGGFGFFFVL